MNAIRRTLTLNIADLFSGKFSLKMMLELCRDQLGVTESKLNLSVGRIANAMRRVGKAIFACLACPTKVHWIHLG